MDIVTRILYSDHKIAVLQNQSPLQQLTEEIERNQDEVIIRAAKEALIDVILRYANSRDHSAIELAMKYKSCVKVIDAELC